MINYSFFETPIPIDLDNNSIIKAVESGSIKISMTVNGISRLFELQDVVYILNMRTNNLLSVTYIVWKGYCKGICKGTSRVVLSKF